MGNEISTKAIILAEETKDDFFVLIESGASKFMPASSHTLCFAFKEVNFEVSIRELFDLLRTNGSERMFIRK